MPENARWHVIAREVHTPRIGTVIDDAMRAIEQENKQLKDILPKNFARQELDKRRLVKRLLKKHKYPPEGMEDAVKTVMTQCEM